MSVSKQIKYILNRGRIYLICNPSIIFLIWAFWLTSEYIFFGPFSYIRMHDEGDSFIPMMMMQALDFSGNGFYYWLSYAVCGTDRLAAGYKILDINSLLFLLFPGWLVYGMATFAQRFIAGYFTYRLCRDYLCLDLYPSILAGLTYAISFSSLLYGDAHHSILADQFCGMMGFPLILWLLERSMERHGESSYLLSAITGAAVLFSSNFAVSVPFALPMVLVWFILIRRKGSLKFLVIYSIFSLIILLGNVPLIQAFIANASLSHRAHWPLFGVLGDFDSSLATSISSGFSFIRRNSIYLLIGIAGLLWIRFNDSRYIIITCTVIFCGIVVSLVKPFWTYFVAPHIGFFSGYQFDRFYLLAPFFAALMVGLGLHYFMRERTIIQGENKWCEKRARAQTISCLLVLLFLISLSGAIKVQHAEQWLSGDSYSINYENPDLDYLAKTDHFQPYRVATVAHGLHPGFTNAYGFESVDGYVTLYSFRYQNYWDYVIKPLTLNDTEVFNYFHNWGNRIYLFEPSDGTFNYKESIKFSDYYNLNLLSLANTRYIISLKPLISDNLTLLPSQIQSNIAGSGQGKIAQEVADNLRGRRLYIYRNENCMPRFFLVDRIRIFENASELLDSLSRADLVALRNFAFAETQSIRKRDADRLGFKYGNITLREYSPDRILFDVNLTGPAILIITNSYSPYWKCRTDDTVCSVFPVDGTFCGVYLNGGKMNVTLEYQPPYRSFY